jgi:DNA-binding beta-propeller fold protein YncE/mono/diheme cytochrome c family protein
MRIGMRAALWGSWIGIAALATLGAASCGGTAPSPAKTAAGAKNAGAKATALPGAGSACARTSPGTGPTRLENQREGSSVVLARSGETTVAYVADEDADALHTMDVTTGKALATTELAGSPSQVLVLADGRVAVALRDKNQVQIFEPTAELDAPLAGRCSVKTPVEPVGLTVTPNDKTILVTSAWAKKLSAFSAATLKKKFDKELPREPRDVVVDDDGERAFVAHVVGGMVSVVDLKDRRQDAREIDLRVPKGFAGNKQLQSSCQGFALAKSIQGPSMGSPSTPQGRIFAPRVTIDPGEPSQRSTGYGGSLFARVESPIVSVIDAAAERNLTSMLLDTNVSRHTVAKGECLLPRAARVSQSSGGLLVACVGTDALVEMDPRGNDPARLERRRWKVPSGPTGVAVDDLHETAVVWSQFDRQLAIVDLKSDTPATAVEIVTAPRLAAGAGHLSADEAWGRKLFHKTDDARVSRDGRACASCHPDGREDALTWSTPVGPRQTLMLAGRVKNSAPYSWLGVHETVEVHLHNTFERLGGSGLPDVADGRVGELDALVAYLNAMPGPSFDESDSDEPKLVAQGKELFHASDVGCSSCHTAGRGADGEKHDLGTFAVGDSEAKFDTPALRYVSGTAPYFHDGRYPTLLSLLTSTDSQMGHTMQLSRSQALALNAYLETL